MNIHNQMQDVVGNLVAEIFDEEKSTKSRSFCVCSQCKLDVLCYVLNRVEPRYVISERGVAHTENEYSKQVQETADIVALIHEGIERVSTTKRPFFSHGSDDTFYKTTGAVFNYPLIKGRLFNGSTFEPIQDVDVFLRSDKGVLEMVDPNWQNPCHIYESGAGAFFFLPAPQEADGPGEEQTFQFEILVEDSQYDPLHHFFSMSAVSSERYRYALHTNESHSTSDLYLFPKE